MCLNPLDHTSFEKGAFNFMEDLLIVLFMKKKLFIFLQWPFVLFVPFLTLGFPRRVSNKANLLPCISIIIIMIIESIWSCKENECEEIFLHSVVFINDSR